VLVLTRALDAGEEGGDSAGFGPLEGDSYPKPERIQRGGNLLRGSSAVGECREEHVPARPGEGVEVEEPHAAGPG